MIRVDAKGYAIFKALALVTLPIAACTISTTDKGAGAGGMDSGGSGGDQKSGGSTSAAGSNTAGRAGGDSGAAGADEAGAGGVGGGEAGAGGGEAGAAGSAGAAGDVGCIQAINSTIVVRRDSLAVEEGPPEKVVIDASSGTTNTPLANVVAVQQNQYASCAIVKGGQVACWQNDAANGNVYGQLGNGTLTPVAVYRASTVLSAADTPLTKVISLASGLNSNAACAITSDGKLWCWGELSWIANGGTKLDSSYAQTIMGSDGQSPLTGVIQATVAYQQGCALVSGSPNTVWCWGTGLAEELGQGDTKNHQYPVQVSGLTNPSKVVLSYASHTNNLDYYSTACALDGGAVECWGANDAGATGSSAGTGAVPAPTLVTTSTGSVLRGVTELIEGQTGFAVLRSDATIWTWGAPAGSTAYAKAYGIPNVSQIAWAGGGSIPIRYLTTDGVYHTGMTNIDVNCGSFE